ncbi:MAG: aminopeptidase P family protein, partial [Desulfovibrionaceae bacterium]|nr:aminopeptidase P family protein [Desulfovibrionaceae bacterium]
SLLREKAAGPIGVEATAVSLELFRKMSPGLALRAADGLVEELRSIKDAGEIAAMERSCALNHRLMEWLPARLLPGRTERDISWDIEKFFRENGASELAFANIVAVGPNAALPHYIPGDATVTENCPVLIDVGGRLECYCSDQTRTFWVGERPAEAFTRTLELVRAAQDAAIKAMRPGMLTAEAYKIARGVFEAAGEAAFFTHGLGHGVGLETHEAPSLGARAAVALKPGMVVTVEPGLYYPQWGGVRWEYMILVEEDGVRAL